MNRRHAITEPQQSLPAVAAAPTGRPDESPTSSSAGPHTGRRHPAP